MSVERPDGAGRPEGNGGNGPEGGGPEESPDQEPLSSDVFKTIRRIAGGSAPLLGAFSVVQEVFAPYQREARLFREERKRSREGLPSPTDLPDLPNLTGNDLTGNDAGGNIDAARDDTDGHDDSSGRGAARGG
jgi:hypothetical protein